MATSITKELTPEALKIYDRQRFIGLDVQRRLLNSLILLHPLNGVITELAKNLVLCGCNLVLYDNTNINEEDVETNFLFSPKDLSHSKAHTLRSKLLEMNPLVSIEIIEELKLDDSKELEKFNIIAISTGSFGEMEKWDQISRKNNVPVYILWCCGLYAFFYACLGNDYKYVKNLKKEKKDEEGNDNGAQEFHVKPLDFKETLQGSNNKRVKDVFWGIKMMYLAEGKELKYDPFKDSKEKEKEFVELLKKTKDINEKQNEFLQKFVRFYGLNFIPVYSVLGSVASQEFIKVIGRDQEPGKGWFCYDSEEGYGKFEIYN